MLGFALFLLGACRSGSANDPAPDDAPAPECGSLKNVGPLEDEAGFIDVPAQVTAARYPARMFYVFEAADSDAANKPLAVFFNGGPGAPTSAGLLSYGTSRYSLDALDHNAPPTRNPARWTRFANLLYIDERQTGFSYGLDANGSVSSADCTFSPVEDAADFVRTILSFLGSHPALQCAPVIVVGESYGGTRATYVLDLLLRYSTEAKRSDPRLEGEIQAHYDTIFPSRAGKVIGIASARKQFGWTVLIQPLVAGQTQVSLQSALIPRDPYVGHVSATQDSYDVLQPAGWASALDSTAEAAFGTPSSAALLLTQDPRDIPRLGPSDRLSAFRIQPRPTAYDATDAALAATVGVLGPGDDYFASGPACAATATEFSGDGSAQEFGSNLSDGVHTFITNARYDSVMYSPAILALLYLALGAGSVTIDPQDSAVARPGGFTIAGTNGMNVHVRFPSYTESGHMVAATQRQELHDDVAQWFAATLGTH